MSKNLFLLSLLVSLSCLEASIPSKNLQKVPRKLEDYITTELTFVKAYDLTFSASFWQFKIEVKDDDKLKENDKLKLDIVAKEGTSYTNGYVDCTFKDHILSCGGGDLADKNTNMIKLKLSTDKKSGTITWKNLNEQYISIPLNHTFTFKNAYGAFYTDKWHFLIKATNTGISPKYSRVIIDIIQNTKETTATCQLLNEGSENNEEDIYCISDYPYQSSSDELKLNTNKKYGSIQWTQDINEANIAKAVENKQNTLELVDAYDLHYSNYKWIFTIEAKNPSSREVGIYKADISVTRSTGEIKNTAKCLLYDGINAATQNVKLICACQHGGQRSNELIQLIPKESGSITWNEGFASAYTMTLKTELYLEKMYESNNSGEGSKWTFKIDVNDGILPVNSKVVVGIIKADNTLDVATCQAESSRKLSCNTEDNSATKPGINTIKTEDSSITWKKYEHGYTLEVKYVSRYEYDINLGQFKFNMTILNEGIPLNTLIQIPASYKMQILSAFASCILIESNKFACSLVYDNQESNGYFTISTIGMKNSDSSTKFVDHLFYKRAYSTKFEGNKWKFNVELTDSNLKDGETYVIDIKVDDNLNKANCLFNENLLSCEANAADQKKESDIYITRNRENNNLLWHDFPEEGVLLYLEYKIKYKTANGGYKNGQWTFNVWYEPKEVDNSKYGLYTSIDITVNGDPKIAYCKITESPYLICTPYYQGNSKEDVIKIIGNKAPNLGAGIFDPLLSEEIEIKPISMDLEYESLQMELNNGVLHFNLIGKLANDITSEIEEDSYTGVELTKRGETDTINDVTCFTNKIGKTKGSNVNITCESFDFRDGDEITLYRDDKGYSGYVKIIYEGSIDIKPDTDDDTTDKKDDGDNGNGNEDEENSSKYYQHIVVYLLLLILF